MLTKPPRACFQPGDRVRVRALFPPGHVRTPWYIRGKEGIIERVLPAFPNPEECAYGRSGLPGQPLYRVRFLQRELWPDYQGAAGDTIDVEIYQHWLEDIRKPKHASRSKAKPKKKGK
ncbi:MAG: SH3-like domain-containing protein [Gemmataceae bacterium]